MIEKLGVLFGVLLASILISLLLAYPVMHLWNIALVDAVTWAKPVGWIQTWCIMVLVQIVLRASVSAEIK
jgi:hypothetical protein